MNNAHVATKKYAILAVLREAAAAGLRLGGREIGVKAAARVSPTELTIPRNTVNAYISQLRDVGYEVSSTHEGHLLENPSHVPTGANGKPVTIRTPIQVVERSVLRFEIMKVIWANPGRVMHAEQMAPLIQPNIPPQGWSTEYGEPEINFLIRRRVSELTSVGRLGYMIGGYVEPQFKNYYSVLYEILQKAPALMDPDSDFVERYKAAWPRVSGAAWPGDDRNTEILPSEKDFIPSARAMVNALRPKANPVEEAALEEHYKLRAAEIRAAALLYNDAQKG